jgi:hypothetical protein
MSWKNEKHKILNICNIFFLSVGGGFNLSMFIGFESWFCKLKWDISGDIWSTAFFTNYFLCYLYNIIGNKYDSWLYFVTISGFFLWAFKWYQTIYIHCKCSESVEWKLSMYTLGQSQQIHGIYPNQHTRMNTRCIYTQNTYKLYMSINAPTQCCAEGEFFIQTGSGGMYWQQIYQWAASWDVAGWVVTSDKTFYNTCNKQPTQVYKWGPDH